MHDYLTVPIRRFVDRSLEKHVVVGFFEVNKKEAERNLVRAVNDLARARGVGSRYVAMGFKDRAKQNMERLFSRLVPFPYLETEAEFQACKKFFTDNPVDLFARTGVRKDDDMPDDNDIRLLIATSKLPHSRRMILTEDVDLWGYAPEIAASQYCVEVIAARELNQHFDDWQWP